MAVDPGREDARRRLADAVEPDAVLEQGGDAGDERRLRLRLLGVDPERRGGDLARTGAAHGEPHAGQIAVRRREHRDPAARQRHHAFPVERAFQTELAPGDGGVAGDGAGETVDVGCVRRSLVARAVNGDASVTRRQHRPRSGKMSKPVERTARRVEGVEGGVRVFETADEADGVSRRAERQRVATPSARDAGGESLADLAAFEPDAREGPVAEHQRRAVGERPAVLDGGSQRTRAEDRTGDRCRRGFGVRGGHVSGDAPVDVEVDGVLGTGGVVSGDDESVRARPHRQRDERYRRRLPRCAGVARHDQAAQVGDGGGVPPVEGGIADERRRVGQAAERGGGEGERVDGGDLGATVTDVQTIETGAHLGDVAGRVEGRARLAQPGVGAVHRPSSDQQKTAVEAVGEGRRLLFVHRSGARREKRAGRLHHAPR